MSDKSTVTMTFHIDPELKREVTEIVRDYGLNLTSVTRAFYKQIVRDGSIPLSFRYDAKGIGNPYELLGASEASGEIESFSDRLGKHPGNSEKTLGMLREPSGEPDASDVAMNVTSKDPEEALID